MEGGEAKSISLKLMECSKATYLYTIDQNGFPPTREMTNVRKKDQYPEFINFFNKQENKHYMFFSTNTLFSKPNHIRENPKIFAHYCDPDDFKVVMFKRVVEVIEDLDIKRTFFLNSSFRYYPKEIEDPSYTILRLNPYTSSVYYKLQKIDFNLGEQE
jgi:general stress protein 26